MFIGSAKAALQRVLNGGHNGDGNIRPLPMIKIGRAFQRSNKYHLIWPRICRISVTGEFCSPGGFSYATKITDRRLFLRVPVEWYCVFTKQLIQSQFQ